MKRFSFLLFAFLLSTFHASSRTHFITAGQTQGMIFTDYVPDYEPVWNMTWNGSLPIQNFDFPFDLNHDGTDDFVLTGEVDYPSGHSDKTTYNLIPLNQNCVLSVIDTVRFQLTPSTDLCVVAKKNIINDTIKNVNDTAWHNNLVLVFYEDRVLSATGWMRTNYILPLHAEYYYFLKVITPPDTLLGYLHFAIGYRGEVLDFACEGPDTAIIINSTNDLSSSRLLVSPNPFTSFINITSEKTFQYTISDYMGRAVMEGESDKTIATEALASGSYVLTIKNEEMVAVKKMVKYNP